MKLDTLAYNIDEYEHSISEIMLKNELAEGDIKSICLSFEQVVGSVLMSMKGTGYCRWGVDDFLVEQWQSKEDGITLRGVVYWLVGGDGCDLFQIDVAKGTDILLYSFKFSQCKRIIKQTLYIGKTYNGWIINY